MPHSLFVACELAKEGFGSMREILYELDAEKVLAAYDYLLFRRACEKIAIEKAMAKSEEEKI